VTPVLSRSFQSSSWVQLGVGKKHLNSLGILFGAIVSTSFGFTFQLDAILLLHALSEFW
jgi:hypothetical protein